ncbi:FAD/NAD(P)-binding domain-containing protein [Aspergillus heteromorphus CBS 117.55]|uniref:FAD/NAD(P)-binding domain-containing protein n=1 Tax=Aspergillus heteromorphus CBS 117.55 TaxID=1448321 RepID=A0A317W3P0_9EURO|nr:FAD/NAD(P)-binding domain-containing protein [Aspergillus heteromorphus CBS 117.55]PWY79738.1 FAD/NAD(P)-binding domain-containing protein [Aspergillus heteromorphus CBS 117.55]
MPERPKYDYIIIGGGTAGCALASRLKAGSPPPRGGRKQRATPPGLRDRLELFDCAADASRWSSRLSSGMAELVENRVCGKRQISSSIYPFNGDVMTDSLVSRVIVQERGGGKVAIGVELADEERSPIRATRQVILSAGAYCTPQILMLSGIGPRDHLRDHDIDWKLKHLERGLALGSPALTDPACFRGNPIDFVVLQPVPLDGLRSALRKDNPDSNPDEHPLVSSQRGHVETFTVYVAHSPQNPTIATDGTHITTGVACMLAKY